MKCKVAVFLVLSLLTEALPPPQQAELYKDDNGNYKINYSVETDKGVISVRQHHRNLDAIANDSPVRVKLDPEPLEADPLPPVKKYYPVKSKRNPPPQSEESDYPLTDNLPPPPPPPRYTSYRSKYLPLVQPSEEPIEVPKYSYGSRIPPPNKAAPPPPEELPPPVDELPPSSDSSNYLPPENREREPLRKNQVLSGILSQINNSKEGLLSTPKVQRDKLYSMGFLYMKNLWKV